MPSAYKLHYPETPFYKTQHGIIVLAAGALVVIIVITAVAGEWHRRAIRRRDLEEYQRVANDGDDDGQYYQM